MHAPHLTPEPIQRDRKRQRLLHLDARLTLAAPKREAA